MLEIAATTRSDYLRTRVDELMLSDLGTVELIEEIQQAGGLAHKSLCRNLRRVLENPPRSYEHEHGLDMAAAVLRAQAHRRAAGEWDRRERSAA